MGGIFFAILKRSFRTIKLRFLETTEIVLAWDTWVAIIIEAIPFLRNATRTVGFAIADCPFYSSTIAADSDNYYSFSQIY